MRTRDERGGVAVLTGLLVVVLVTMASFTVDLGMQRVVRSDMQAVADVVALDAARLLDGRTAQEIRDGSGSQPSLAATVAASVDRNTSSLGSVTRVTAELVTLTADSNGAWVPVTNASGQVVPVAGGDVPAAVWVQAVGSVEYAFRSGSGSAVRTAIANATPVACFRLGSWALSVAPGDASDPESARLNEMLGIAFGVSVASYHGLADSSVSVHGLAAELGAGSAEELVALQNVRLRDLFQATARALGSSGGDTADVALLNSLAVNTQSELDATVDLADLLTVTSTGASGLAGEINVLDVLASSAYAVDGDHFLDIQNLWEAPKFHSGTQELQLIERPRGACGAPGPSTRAQTAQLRFAANPELNTSSLALSSGDPVVSLDVLLAGGAATLSSVTCGDGTDDSPESIEVQVIREVSRVNFTATIPLAGELKLSELGLLDLADLTALFSVPSLPGVNAKATLALTVNAGSSVTTTDFGRAATYAVPPHDYTDAEVVGDGASVVLPTVTIDAADITGTVTYNGRTKDIQSAEVASRIDLTNLIDEVMSEVVTLAINDFIGNVNEELTTVAALLGLHTSGVDLMALRRPGCSNPALRG